jgi:hypothetical protein
VLESLYRKVILKRDLNATFYDLMKNIVHIVDGMGEEARKRYLIESLFMNSVTYENERLGAYMKKLTGRSGAEDEPTRD